MGSGRVKRKKKRDSIRKIDTHETDYTGSTYSLVGYTEATVVLYQIATVALQRETGREAPFMREDYSKWKTGVQSDTHNPEAYV